MNDREMLDLLASDAPAPRAGHVERVIRRARRTRTVRRVAGVGAVLVVAAGSVTVFSGQVAGPSPVEVAPSAASPAVSPSPSRVLTAAESDPYIAAILNIAGRVPELYVRDGFCDVMDPYQPCRKSLPAQLRKDIVAVLPFVRFVPVGAEAKLPMVAFNELRREGEFVDIPISVVRGGLDAEGKTYRLKKVGEQWQVTGTVGGMWIS